MSVSLQGPICSQHTDGYNPECAECADASREIRRIFCKLLNEADKAPLSEREIDALMQRAYQDKNRALTPKFPWVLVRCLHREQVLEGIILPEAQNKTSLEAVVLAVWHPFTPRASFESLWAAYEEAVLCLDPKGEAQAFHNGADSFRRFMEQNTGNLPKFFNVNYSAEHWEHQEQIQSELKPGDHVLFPAWAGMPVEGYDKKYYRFVKECNWSVDKEGGIFAKIDYDKPPVSEKLKQLLLNYRCSEMRETDELELLSAIDEAFLLVDRNENSATLSGR